MFPEKSDKSGKSVRLETEFRMNREKSGYNMLDLLRY